MTEFNFITGCTVSVHYFPCTHQMCVDGGLAEDQVGTQIMLFNKVP